MLITGFTAVSLGQNGTRLVMSGFWAEFLGNNLVRLFMLCSTLQSGVG